MGSMQQQEAVPHQAPQRWKKLTLEEDARARRSASARQAQWNYRALQDDSLQSPFPSVLDILEPKVVWEHSAQSFDEAIDRVIVGEHTVSTSEEISFPTLLDILEPKIVWEHAKGFDRSIGKVMQGGISVEKFLQHYGRGGRPAYGVYEGSYKDLILALNELTRSLAAACECSETLREAPELLVDEEELPVWEDFEPLLEAAPPRPQAKPQPLLRAPLFKPSDFCVPKLPEVPLLIPEWEDVPPPPWVEPEPPHLPDFVPWEFEDNVPHPILPAPPVHLTGNPHYGLDWSGTSPRQKAARPWKPKQKRFVPEVSLRPMQMPDEPELMPPVQGLLSGTAPVLLLDHSGTMNPRIGGLFELIKSAAVRLLCPDEGQIRNTAWKFDVVAFAGQASAWSQTYTQKQVRLEEDLSRGVGTRPNNGAPTPYSMLSPDKKTEYMKIAKQVAAAKGEVKLMPATADVVQDAQAWVDSLPLPSGVTQLQRVLQLMENSESYANCDSVFLFSDGKVSEPGGIFQALDEWRARKGKVPPFNCIGFYPIGRDGEAGERFLQELSARTGGSYRVYDEETEALLTHRVESKEKQQDERPVETAIPTASAIIEESRSIKSHQQQTDHDDDDAVAQAEKMAEDWLESLLTGRRSLMALQGPDAVPDADEGPDGAGAGTRSTPDSDAVRSAIEAKNRQLREAWLERRRKDMGQYRDAVNEAYVAHFADEVSVKWAQQEAIAQREVDMGKEGRARELAEVARANRNARLRHHEEVMVRREEERQFYGGVARCMADREKALLQYEEEMRSAIGEHVTAVATAAENHRIRATEIKREARDSVWAAYQEVAIPLKKWNEQRSKDVDKQREDHFAMVQRCTNITQAAWEEHERTVARERTEHEAALERLTLDNERESAAAAAENTKALEEWSEAAAAVEERNREKLARAQRRYQEALEEAREACVKRTAEAEEEHARAAAEAEEHNERVRPMVDRAAKPARELQRVLAFAENIAKCAKKQCMGVNLQWMAVPQTDRVVEMTSLLESLRLAFHEFPIDGLPWPNRTEPGKSPGTGCWPVDASPSEGTLAHHHTMSAPQIGYDSRSTRPRSAKDERTIATAPWDSSPQLDSRASSSRGNVRPSQRRPASARASAASVRDVFVGLHQGGARPASARSGARNSRFDVVGQQQQKLPIRPDAPAFVGLQGSRSEPPGKQQQPSASRPSSSSALSSAQSGRSVTMTGRPSSSRPASAFGPRTERSEVMMGRQHQQQRLTRPSSAFALQSSRSMTSSQAMTSQTRTTTALRRPQTAPMTRTAHHRDASSADSSTAGRSSGAIMQLYPEASSLSMEWITGTPSRLFERPLSGKGGREPYDETTIMPWKASRLHKSKSSSSSAGRR